MGQSEPFTRALIPFPDLFQGLTWFANAKVFLAQIWHEPRKKSGIDQVGEALQDIAFHTSLDGKTRIC